MKESDEMKGCSATRACGVLGTSVLGLICSKNILLVCDWLPLGCRCLGAVELQVAREMNT